MSSPVSDEGRMGLRVTHLAGPKAGTTERLFTQDDIHIGRGPDCRDGICFADDVVAVGRGAHVTLHKDAGRYEIRVSSDRRVLVNGRLAMDGQELPARAELQLGPKSEIRLLVELVKPDNMPQTAKQSGSEDDAERLGRTARRLGLTAVLVLLAVLGLWQLAKQQSVTDKELAQTQAGLQTLATKESDEARVARLAPELLPSVMLVVRKDGMGGTEALATAWVVGDRLVATNAHVAGAFEELRADAGQELFVRSSAATPVDYRITGVTMHPAFGEFVATWTDYGPSQEDGEQYPSIGGYDVALMTVEASESALPPALKIAPREALLALKPGQMAFAIGYPMENMVPNDIQAPSPEVQRGSITSLTDFFRSRVDAENAVLVKHSIPSAGGASGSPIFDSQGRVIAVLSGGNVMMVEALGQRFRMPHAAAVNFAQRADLLQALIDQEDIDLDILRERWAASLGRFREREQEPDEAPVDPCDFDRLSSEWTARVNADGKSSIRTLINDEFTLAASVLEQIEELDVAGRRFEVPSEISHHLFAYAVASDGTDIDMIARLNGEVAVVDSELDHCPSGFIRHVASDPLSLYIVGGQNDGAETRFRFVLMSSSR